MNQFIIETLEKQIKVLTFYAMKYKDDRSQEDLEQMKKALLHFKKLIARLDPDQ